MAFNQGLWPGGFWPKGFWANGFWPGVEEVAVEEEELGSIWWSDTLRKMFVSDPDKIPPVEIPDLIVGTAQIVLFKPSVSILVYTEPPAEIVAPSLIQGKVSGTVSFSTAQISAFQGAGGAVSALLPTFQGLVRGVIGELGNSLVPFTLEAKIQGSVGVSGWLNAELARVQGQGEGIYQAATDEELEELLSIAVAAFREQHGSISDAEMQELTLLALLGIDTIRRTE